MEYDYDIIIIGGGGGGMTAALFAHAAGAKVMILEADKKLGGATQYSEGVVYAAGTSVQRAQGIEDSAQAMFDYIMTLNAWQTRPDIIRLFAERSAMTIEWLISLGAKYEWVVKSGVDTVPRGHCTVGAGAEIARLLSEAVGGQGIETVLATRVDSLIEENGAIVGVRASGAELRSKAVIITTGGFGNSPGMRAKYFPSVAQHGDIVYAVHNFAPFILGDGIKLGEAVGAAVTGHDTGLMLPSAALIPNAVEAFLPPWTMLVNDEGRRFMPENSPYAVSGYLINEQTRSHAWAIFDEKTMIEGSQDKRFSDPYHTGAESQTWDEALIRKHAATGKIKTAPTLEALADQLNIDRFALAETMRRYNEDAHAGQDSEWQKVSPKYFPLENGPFYAVEVRASVIGQTSAGLDIDTQGRVRDIHGRPLPGLYAAGEVLGCVQGKRYSGGGMGVGNALTFGRLAGEEAAKYAASKAS
ncbi:FAD-dependent oxidoreductase [Acidocella sp. KAb 2-4]|uniref:FAD-dependent oxidoreductase n=1 Tax=Acidocella sp. KAb 2-4 TaxID=2885158 RepID=UPI001D096252|nr:FAD-dependent oxidoreductase [Acidocella sp. KAb 2-4]MCB5945567.1 FAD-dependent oxidoreductase [Acidocella sp. KAb 2-4]